MYSTHDGVRAAHRRADNGDRIAHRRTHDGDRIAQRSPHDGDRGADQCASTGDPAADNCPHSGDRITHHTARHGVRAAHDRTDSGDGEWNTDLCAYTGYRLADGGTGTAANKGSSADGVAYGRAGRDADRITQRGPHDG
eukprot:gene10759-19040_t